MSAALMALAVFVCLSSLPAQAQHYEAEESDLSNPCGALSAPLTGSFTPDPCQLTRDRRRSDLRFAHDYYGGQQLIEYLDNWWETEFLPALKDLTKQLSVSKVKQTLDLTMARDASRILETRATIEKEKLEALRDNVVNDQVAIGETPKQGIVAGQKFSNNLRQQLRSDIFQTPGAMSDPVKKYGPALDQKSRWRQYCDIFHDPKDNNGADGCTLPGEEPTNPINQLIDGDIDIEGLMLRETIDFKNTPNYLASLALLQNIVQHKSPQAIPETGINSAAGRETVLAKQHIEAVRNIVADVVASIMTRRAAMILPDVSAGGPTIIDKCPFSVGKPNNYASYREWHDEDPSWNGFKRSLICMENRGGYTNREHLKAPSHHSAKEAAGLIPMGVTGPPPGNTVGNMNRLACLGAYQFCRGLSLPCWSKGGRCRGCDTDWKSQESYWSKDKMCKYGGIEIKSAEDFLANPAAQDAAWAGEFMQVIKLKNEGGMAVLQRYVGGVQCGKEITASGMLTAFHLSGVGGAKSWFGGNRRVYDDVAGTRISGCGPGPRNAMSAKEYSEWFAGYDVTPVLSGVDADIADDPNGVPLSFSGKLARKIAEIRKKAGIPERDIAGEAPSYNEIMLAMTKERFFDPEYFTKIREGKTSLQTEQSSIDSYISIQYQDIYQLQEQINALLAARAALKVNSDQKPSQVQSSPLKN